MNCEAVKELLWAYLEKETTAEEAEEIEKHLAVCAECRAELEAQKVIMETLASLPDEELPEGYHKELMQKLRAEAAPNVVPFPQKKKQPMWKQMSMIAAAVLVVVAAGGMNGMLDMRQNQNEAVNQMAADTAAPAEEIIMEDDSEEITAEVLDGTADLKMSSKKKEPATGVVDSMIAESGTANNGIEMAAYDAIDVAAAVPEMVSIEEETAETTASYDMRTKKAVENTDAVVLLTEDTAKSLAEVQKAIAVAGGHEEAADTENAVIAVIPAEKLDDFSKALESIGEADWTTKGQFKEGAAERRIEIQLITR